MIYTECDKKSISKQLFFIVLMTHGITYTLNNFVDTHTQYSIHYISWILSKHISLFFYFFIHSLSLVLFSFRFLNCYQFSFVFGYKSIPFKQIFSSGTCLLKSNVKVTIFNRVLLRNWVVPIEMFFH